MALSSGKPSNRTQKELAIEAVKNIGNEPEKTKMHRFNVDIPEALHRQMKIKAVQEGVTLNVLATKIFNEYLSK